MNNAGSHSKVNFLNYFRPDNYYRILVTILCNLHKLDDLYFVRRASFRKVFNYIREIGFRAVLQKIASRRAEQYRNLKYVSCGIGKVIETGSNLIACGKYVVFLAPCHSPFIEQLVLPSELVKSVFSTSIQGIEEGYLYHFGDNMLPNIHIPEYIKGWNAFSGIPLVSSECHGVLEDCDQIIRELDLLKAEKRPLRSSEIKTRHQRVDIQKNKGITQKKAVLFGYGNYSKTNIIPSLQNRIYLRCIHEIDPLQIPQKKQNEYIWDTSPFPRKDEEYDAYFIAGYHHTHAQIAVHALKQGAYAIVEKPLVTNRTQLAELVNAVQKFPRKLFACFQKRYSPLNEWALQDLGIESKEPFTYHCIVYEVPLPKRHWYRWPNSKSRLVSNGCHWIDHFLYLNNYCSYVFFDITTASDRTINCSVELKNGSFFTMVLTDKGSPRIGVQDHIELRRNDVTVKMLNSSFYQSENSLKFIRKKRINKKISYQRMYQTIVEKIKNNEPADSFDSIFVGSQLMLDLEEKMYLKLRENTKSAHETNSSES